MAQRILLLGGTGPLGILICKQALQRQHLLTIYARNPTKLPKEISEHSNVKLIEGEITNEPALRRAVQGCKAVISVMGPSLSLANMRLDPEIFINAYRILFKAMRDNNIRRIFMMSTPSLVLPGDRPPMFAKIMVGFLKTCLYGVWKEVVDRNELLETEAQDLDWTLFRVGMLADGKGTIQTETHVGAGGWKMACNRSDIAEWLIDQVEKRPAEYIHEKPALSSSSV